MQLIDTHSHIDIHHFHHDFQEVLQRARAAGVIAQILPGVCQAWWQNLLEICKNEPDLYPAIGLHPLYLERHSAADIDKLADHAILGKLVAVGEIGLDYFRDNDNREKQQELFEAQLDIAERNNLPILLHVRKAHDQVLATLRRKKFSQGGIVHAFGGSLQQAQHYIKNGFALGFGGSLTYDRATKIRKNAADLPLDSIVLETDAPDIPPANHQGERNLPQYLPEILRALASLRHESAMVLAERTRSNSIRILHLKNHPGVIKTGE